MRRTANHKAPEPEEANHLAHGARSPVVTPENGDPRLNWVRAFAGMTTEGFALSSIDAVVSSQALRAAASAQKDHHLVVSPAAPDPLHDCQPSRSGPTLVITQPFEMTILAVTA